MKFCDEVAKLLYLLNVARTLVLLNNCGSMHHNFTKVPNG